MNITFFKHYYDDIYFISEPCSRLWKYDSVKHTCELLYSNDTLIESAYVTFIIHDGILIMPPYLADDFVTYDIGNNKVSSRTFRDSTNGKCLNMYSNIAHVGNKIVVLGGINSTPVCVNDNIDGYSKLEIDPQYVLYLYRGEICYSDTLLVLPLRIRDKVLTYDVKTNTAECFDIGNYGMMINNIVFDGRYYWLSGDKDKIIRWDYSNNEKTAFSVFPDGFSSQNKDEKVDWTPIFSCGIYCNGYIYYAPLHSNMFIRLDISSGQMIKIYTIAENELCFCMNRYSNDKIVATVICKQTQDTTYDLNISDTAEKVLLGETIGIIPQKYDIHRINYFSEEQDIAMLYSFIELIDKHKNVNDKIKERNIGHMIWESVDRC